MNYLGNFMKLSLQFYEIILLKEYSEWPKSFIEKKNHFDHK